MSLWIGNDRPGHAAYRIVDGTTVDVVLHLATQGLRRSRCSLTQSVVPDDPLKSAWRMHLEPLARQMVALEDGWTTFAVSCPSAVGKLTARVRALALDGLPEACRFFDFTRDAITAATYEELRSGVVGTWTGCVATPWTPTYAVTVTLREDGTYSATSNEVLDDVRMIAMYWGSDAESPSKVYAINDFQASRLGVGQIDLSFGGGSVTRDELRNIRLMGDKLEFELFHFGQYGPVTFQLKRASDPT